MDKKISLRVRILANELNRKVAEMLTEDREHFTGTQMHVLNFIHRKNYLKVPVYQKDIEQEFDIRRSTATGILQTLERRGLIERKSCSEDNRFKAVLVTELGSQIVKENISKLRAFDSYLLHDIPKEEVATFLKVADKLSENSKKVKKDGKNYD